MESSRASRDLFPLPPPFVISPILTRPSLSRGTKRRLRSTTAWRGWANDAVVALNELAGGGAPQGTLSAGQTLALDNVRQCFCELGPPPAGLDPTGAFIALCGSASPYFSDDAGPASYDRALLSLPPVSSQAVSPAEMMASAATASTWQSQLLLLLRAPYYAHPRGPLLLIYYGRGAAAPSLIGSAAPRRWPPPPRRG